MPIFVRAGAIIPFDPVRQFTNQVVDEPITLRVYTGADGEFSLYEDDGISLDYLRGEFSLTNINWDDDNRRLIIEPAQESGFSGDLERVFNVIILPEGTTQLLTYSGKRAEFTF